MFTAKKYPMQKGGKFLGTVRFSIISVSVFFVCGIYFPDKGQYASAYRGYDSLGAIWRCFLCENLCISDIFFSLIKLCSHLNWFDKLIWSLRERESFIAPVGQGTSWISLFKSYWDRRTTQSMVLSLSHVRWTSLTLYLVYSV